MEVHHEVALATYPGPLPTLSFSWSLVMMFSSPNCDHKQTPHIAHHLIFFPPPPGLQPQANSQILRHLSSLSLSPNPNPHTITKNPCHSPNNHFQTPQPQLLLCHALVTQRTKRFRSPRSCREMKSLKPQTLMACTYACFKPNFLARYGTVLRETGFGVERRKRLMQEGNCDGIR